MQQIKQHQLNQFYSTIPTKAPLHDQQRWQWSLVPHKLIGTAGARGGGWWLGGKKIEERVAAAQLGGGDKWQRLRQRRGACLRVRPKIEGVTSLIQQGVILSCWARFRGILRWDLGLRGEREVVAPLDKFYLQLLFNHLTGYSASVFNRSGTKRTLIDTKF